MLQKYFIVGVLMLVCLVPTAGAEANYDGEVAAWVPYWVTGSQLSGVTKRLRELDTVYPFVYEVTSSGALVQKTNLKSSGWKKFFAEAKKRKVDVVPTVAWFDGAAIHATLSDTTKRRALVDEIADAVRTNKYAGINIDFEQKQAETIDYFSTFLAELDDELGKTILTCALEARTPAVDLYPKGKVPEVLRYANDYAAINQHCDIVEIMTYDQQRADLTLNTARRGLPYAPVADEAWVEKVIALALEDIDADKIMLGVPLYGRAWDVTVAPDWYRDYDRVAALNYSRILELSKDIYKVPIGRTPGGEGIISYFPQDSIYNVFNQLTAPKGTPLGYEAAAIALFVANYTGREVPVRFVMFGDAEATKGKLTLAEKYNLRGVALWSLNNEEDKAVWKLF